MASAYRQFHRFTRLAAGGNRIRTIGPALPKRSLGCCRRGRRTDKLDGALKHRSSRETTMVGRGVSLHGRLFLGTDGSNPVPSGIESDDADRLFGGRFCGCTALSRLHAFLDERRARLRRRRTPARTQRCLLQAARIAPSKPTTDVVWSSIGKVCSWSRFKAASVPRRQRVVLPRRETAASREA